MNKILFILPLIALCFVSYSQQDSTLFVRGTVTDNETGVPLENVTVTIRGTLSETLTDSLGQFVLSLRSDALLVLNAAVYQQRVVAAEPGKVLAIALTREATELEEVVIGRDGLTPLIASNSFTVLDYGFYDSKLVVLTSVANKSVFQLSLLTTVLDTLSTTILEGKATRLWEDCLGNLHLIGTGTANQVYIEEGQLRLMPGVLLERLEKLLYPCIASSETHLYFSEKTGAETKNLNRFDIQSHNTNIRYYSIHRSTKNFREIILIKDEQTAALQRDEDDYILSKEKAGFYLTSPNQKDYDRIFSETVLFSEIYAPLVILHDTLVIFDYVGGDCLLFTASRPERVSMSYHKEKNWKREMYFDKLNGMAYAVYDTKGIVSLRAVDWRKGTADQSTAIPAVFPQRIQVHNGFAYFLTTMDNTGSTRCLSRIRL